MLTLKERVDKYEYQLNDTDDQIIEYILLHFEEVLLMSIQTLAEQVFTVPNTIVRLSRKLGYDGFSNMKNAMKHELDELEQSVGPNNLNKTRELIDSIKMKDVNQMVHQATRVLIYGIGDSAIYCEYLLNGYRAVNKKCEFYHHRHNILSELETLSAKDLLILISVSGESAQLIEIAERGVDRSIPIVAITDFRPNTLQKIANHSLFFSSPPEYYQQHNITDPTPIFYLLRSLLESYWKKHM